ncbi:MAG: bifunctional diguanylate cyclase/phosphohydrolase [Gaiellaceae bacterium]
MTRRRIRTAAAATGVLLIGLALAGAVSLVASQRHTRQASDLRAAYASLSSAATAERLSLDATMSRRGRFSSDPFLGASKRATGALRTAAGLASGADQPRVAAAATDNAAAVELASRMRASMAKGKAQQAATLRRRAATSLVDVDSLARAGLRDSRLQDTGSWPLTWWHDLELAGLIAVAGSGLVFLIQLLLRLVGYRRGENDRHAQLEQLESVALTDNLTGLRNHRAFHEDLKREITKRNRSGEHFSLLMVDLNGLKQINDSQGHQAGDERIRAVADCLCETLRGQDCAYRTGGDEFMIILSGARAWVGLTVAQRLHATLSRHPSRVSVAVGVAESTQTESKDTLIRHADVALYEAKRSHRGTIAFSPGLEAQQRETETAGTQKHQKLLATSLARAVDAKDAGTRNHCETVSELCVLVGRQLGLPAERLEKLRIAGLLHDVGKIGIADAILQKPGGLGDEESEVMRTHAAIGHSIVCSADLNDEAEWVLHHHERFDGRGYPDRLAGDEIPLESRIIFVADAFEAITSDRPYREGQAPESALEELVANAGSQFDPNCVAALCSLFGHEPSIPLDGTVSELDRRRQARAASQSDVALGSSGA